MPDLEGRKQKARSTLPVGEVRKKGKRKLRDKWRVTRTVIVASATMAAQGASPGTT